MTPFTVVSVSVRIFIIMHELSLTDMCMPCRLLTNICTFALLKQETSKYLCTHIQEHMHMYEHMHIYKHMHMHVHIVGMISHYITDFLLLSNLSRHRCHLLLSTKRLQCIRLTAALAHRRPGRLWIGKLSPRMPPRLLTFTFARRSQVYYLCFVSFECACTYLCAHACVHMHVLVLVRVCAQERVIDIISSLSVRPKAPFLTYTINSACWRWL